MSMVRRVRLLLAGVGNVGRHFLELMARKEETLRSLGLTLVLVGVADRSGAALNPAGLDPGLIGHLKSQGRGVADLPQGGCAGLAALKMIQQTEADLLLEATPANLADGQPGLACIEAALLRCMHVVTANKAPLVLAFPRLTALARERGVELRFDATVAGGLPVVNLGQRDLAGVQIERIEGILNLTANYILARMADDGLSFEQALAEAQAAGQAETDPRLDVEGWDSASKLVILANSVLGQPATLADVAVGGMAHLTGERLREAAAQGKRIKLIATAQRREAGYDLAVQPAWLDADHPLAVLGAEQMGVVFYTDICGVLSAAILEQTPLPTAAAMFRDILLIFGTA